MIRNWFVLGKMYINTNVICHNFYLLKLWKDFCLRIFFSSVNMLFRKIACDCRIQDCLQLVGQLYSSEYIFWFVIASWQMKLHSGTVLGHCQSPDETNPMERVQILSFKSAEVRKVYPLLQFWHNRLFTLGIGDSQIS